MPLTSTRVVLLLAGLKLALLFLLCFGGALFRVEDEVSASQLISQFNNGPGEFIVTSFANPNESVIPSSPDIDDRSGCARGRKAEPVPAHLSPLISSK